MIRRFGLLMTGVALGALSMVAIADPGRLALSANAASTETYRQLREAMRASPEASFEEQLAHERDAMAKALGGNEAQAGIGAFLTKTSPVFR